MPEGGAVYPQRHRQHDDLHHQLGPDHAVQPQRHIHEDEKRDVQKALAAEGEQGGRNPWGAKTAKHTTKQADSSRAIFQEK